MFFPPPKKENKLKAPQGQDASGPLKTCKFPTAWITMNKISRMALRVRPRRSLEILMFLAVKIVAQTSRRWTYGWVQNPEIAPQFRSPGFA